MKLYLRTTKTDGEATLYANVNMGTARKWVSLGMKVNIADWLKTYTGVDDKNRPIQSDKKVENLLAKLGHLKKVQDIELAWRSLREKNKLDMENMTNAVDVIINADVRAENDKQQERIRKAEEAKRKAELEKQKDVKRYVDKFVSSLTGEEADSMTKKGEAYKARSIKIWQQFHRVFNDFYKTHKVGSWDSVDKNYINKFSLYLEKRYMMSTRVRYISCLRTIIGRAFNEELRTKPIASDMFYRPTVHKQDAATEIYLTKEELEALYSMELHGLKEQVRDLFLIGCFCGQRFSDYKRIDSSCIGTTAKGTSVIRLVQVKTGKLVVVPIVDEHLVSLLEKYNYDVPQVVDVVFNRYIKIICKDLSATVPSLAEYVPTILTKKEKEAEKAGAMSFERDKQGRVIKHRYELVMSHTARRTCITLMSLSGKFTIKQMMSVSGHTKTETFFRYMKQSEEDAADNVAESAQDGLF